MENLVAVVSFPTINPDTDIQVYGALFPPLLKRSYSCSIVLRKSSPVGLLALLSVHYEKYL